METILAILTAKYGAAAVAGVCAILFALLDFLDNATAGGSKISNKTLRLIVWALCKVKGIVAPGRALARAIAPNVHNAANTDDLRRALIRGGASAVSAHEVASMVDAYDSTGNKVQ